MQTTCPNCSTSYDVRDESAGRTAKCRECGEQFALVSSAPSTRRAKATLHSKPPRLTKQVKRTDTIGRFEIRSKIGAGGFGAVYRAYDPMLERDVALKMPHPGGLDNETDRARYLREPKAAAQLRHPNIVPIHDANFDGDTFYIASAFIEGRTLKDVIRDDPPDFKTSTEIVAKLAAALNYAHSIGIVHRDVKPANIMIDQKGEPLLMDFGLARLFGTPDLDHIKNSGESNRPAGSLSASSELTQAGKFLGTPAYAAPEQIAGEVQNIGAHTDQYSLGTVLFELICGERPFHGPPDLIQSLVVSEECRRFECRLHSIKGRAIAHCSAGEGSVGAAAACGSGGDDAVNCVGFSLDGSRIAAGSRSVTVLDATSGRALRRIHGFEDEVDIDNWVKLWDATPAED